MVAGAVLTAVLALVAVPGLVVSRPPTPPTTLEASAFQAVRLAAPAPAWIQPSGGSIRRSLQRRSWLAVIDSSSPPSPTGMPL